MNTSTGKKASAVVTVLRAAGRLAGVVLITLGSRADAAVSLGARIALVEFADTPLLDPPEGVFVERSEPSVAYELNVSYPLGDTVALEAAYSHLDSFTVLHQATVEFEDPTPDGTIDYRAEQRSELGLLRVRLDWSLHQRLTVYLAPGAHVERRTRSLRASTTHPLIDLVDASERSRDSSIGWNIAAGLAFQASNAVALVLDVAYLDLDDNSAWQLGGGFRLRL